MLPTITPSIGFEPAYVQPPLADFLGSLAKVRAMPDLRLLPAHGPVSPSLHARDRRAGRVPRRAPGAVAGRGRGGCHDAWAVARELPWTRRHRRASDLDPFDAVLAAFETLAHLELLAARGSSAAPRTTGPSASALSHLRHRRCLVGMTTTHLSSTDASSDRDSARRARIRVPLKTPSGIFGRIVMWYSRRTFGDVPDPRT